MENGKETTGKCIIVSAPSGAGKTTIVHALLKRIDNLAFSVSACSRPARENEKDGEDYYFLSTQEFKNKIKNDDFIEWQEVYKDHFYGTLKSEVYRLWKEKKIIVFDVDVYGGFNLKKYFGPAALSFFIKPPSIEVLKKRLYERKTETEDNIEIRLKKSTEELAMAEKFDHVVINQNLDMTVEDVEKFVKEYLEK